MKQLPENFCIKRDADNPLWKKYIDWLYRKYYRELSGVSNIYYGVWDRKAGYYLEPGNATVLTLEQWDAIVNPKPVFKIGDWVVWSGNKPVTARIHSKAPTDEWGDNYVLDVYGDIESWNYCSVTYLRYATPEEIDAAFELPEKWAVKVEDSQITDWFNNYGVYDCLGNYLHYPACDGYHTYSGIQEGYSEISFDQFKKYVLKENTMEKKILGYKFKLDAYNAAASGLYNKLRYAGNVSSLPLNSEGFHFPVKSNMETFLIKEDLLERWAEPVYAAEPLAINIKSEHNQYKVIVKEDISRIEVYFGGGYANIPVDEIQQLSVLINRLEDYKIAGHNVKIDSISIGCQKNIPVSELKKVFKVVDNLK